jgi:hypothetical protein
MSLKASKSTDLSFVMDFVSLVKDGIVEFVSDDHPYDWDDQEDLNEQLVDTKKLTIQNLDSIDKKSHKEIKLMYASCHSKLKDAFFELTSPPPEA